MSVSVSRPFLRILRPFVYLLISSCSLTRISRDCKLVPKATRKSLSVSFLEKWYPLLWDLHLRERSSITSLESLKSHTRKESQREEERKRKPENRPEKINRQRWDDLCMSRFLSFFSSKSCTLLYRARIFGQKCVTARVKYTRKCQWRVERVHRFLGYQQGKRERAAEQMMSEKVNLLLSLQKTLILTPKERETETANEKTELETRNNIHFCTHRCKLDTDTTDPIE